MRIDSTAEMVQEQIPHIQPTTPPWLATLKLWGWVLGILAVGGLAIYLGVGPLIRRLLTSLGWFLPESVTKEAELTRRAIEADVPLTSDQVRALEIRKQDPTFRAAWDKTATTQEVEQ